MLDKYHDSENLNKQTKNIHMRGNPVGVLDHMAIINAIVPSGNYLYKDPMEMLFIATENSNCRYVSI